MKRALVTGAGGFIGGHLVRYLKDRGYWVRGVDIKPHEFAESAADEFCLLDLRYVDSASAAFAGQAFDEVYALAADMGGMGYISQHHANILRNNLLINLNTIEAARQTNVGRYFFSSSACVYPEYRQETTDAPALSEDMAYPAAPQDAYGWEKLTTERLLLHYRDDYGMDARIARFHNVFGPFGTWQGGREKAPAALCRKVAEAAWCHGWSIDVWGDGKQTRSFLYIDDCLEGIYRLMQSDYRWPLNIGSDEMIDIDGLAYQIMAAAGHQFEIVHVEGPVGVRGRNSDNTLCKVVLGWEPQTSLEDGLAQTYTWIAGQVEAARA